MDPNGVPMPRRSLTEHQYTEEQLREMKQKFLLENVINCGYDATEFAQFMEYKMRKSPNHHSRLFSDSTFLRGSRGRHERGQLGVRGAHERRLRVPAALLARGHDNTDGRGLARR